jgi:hypothetical protein
LPSSFRSRTQLEKGFLDKSFNDPEDHCKQEDENGNLVDAMHHPKIDVARCIGVRLSEYSEKIIPYLTQLKKLFHLIFFFHEKFNLIDNQEERN